MHQDDSGEDERRRHWPRDADFFDRLERHMWLEEQREKADNKRLDDGAKRMELIEEDLKPLKKLYWAVMGSGAAVAALVGVLLFIYSNDRADARVMQDAIYKQGTAIELLIRSHQELERDYRRDIDRIEKHRL